MKVYYQLNVNDIKQLIAEKYGVSTKGIGTCTTPEGPGFMVDMSKTETPAPIVKSYRAIQPTAEEIQKLHDLSMEMFHPKKEKPAEEKKEPEKEEPKPMDGENQEALYKFITDEVLEAKIKAGKTIPEICADFSLTDSKYSARLYKRAEQFRKEGARLGRRRNQEKTQDTKPTAG